MSTSVNISHGELVLDQFEGHIRGAQRAATDKVAGSTLITLVITAAATTLSFLVAESAVTVFIILAATLVITYALAFKLGPWSRRRKAHLIAAADIAQSCPEVLKHGDTVSMALIPYLSPGLSLTKADILSYRTRVHKAVANYEGFSSTADAIISELEEEAHNNTEQYLAEYFSGVVYLAEYFSAVEMRHAPSNSDALAEIERVGAEFVAALTSPENLIAGEVLSDTTIPEVDRVYAALAAAHDPTVNLPEAARELNMSWSEARDLI